MDQSRLDLVELAPDNLFGTGGVLEYITGYQRFSGRFGSTGEPVFEPAWFRQRTPIVQPHLGQQFDGLWVPDAPLQFLVLDTGHLRLAFHCPAIVRCPVSLSDPVRLRIQAVQAPGQNNPREVEWRGFQLQSPNAALPDWFSPIVDATTAVYSSNPGFCQVPWAKALAYVAEEQSWITEQRHELRPPNGAELSPVTAREAASFNVLGRNYSRVMTEKWLLEELLRTIDSGQPNPRFMVVNPVTRAEVAASLEGKTHLYDQMAQLSSHPKLEHIINDRTKWLLARDQAMERRLVGLSRLRANISAQAANHGLAVETMPAAAASENVKQDACTGVFDPSPAPNHSLQTHQLSPKRPRIRF